MAIVAYEEPKVIVIYNVKCAQSSLYLVFGRLWNRTENDYFKNDWAISDLANLSDFSKKINLDDYFIMDFVRNPYSRMTSMWAFSRHPDGINTNIPTDFEKWLKTCYNDWKTKSKPHFSYPISLSHFVDDISLDFIGRQETLDQDVKFVADKFGIEFKGVPKSNYSFNTKKSDIPEEKYISWQDRYTPELKEMVAEMYVKDFEMFGYEK